MQKAVPLAPPCRSVFADLTRELGGGALKRVLAFRSLGRRGRRRARPSTLLERVAVYALVANITAAYADHSRRFSFEMTKRADYMAHGPAFASLRRAAICEPRVGHFHFLSSGLCSAPFDVLDIVILFAVRQRVCIMGGMRQTHSGFHHCVIIDERCTRNRRFR